MATVEKLKRQRDRIKELLEAPPNSVAHRGGQRVVANFKKQLKRLNTKISKLENQGKT